MKRLKFAMLMFSLLMLGAMTQQSARAQDLSTSDAIALRNQILQLQAQVNALQASQGNSSANNSGPAPAPAPAANAPPSAASNNDLMASLLTRVSNLEDQVRTLTGQVDQLQNDLKNQNQQLTKQIGDINFQLQGGTPSTPDANSPNASGANTPGTDASGGTSPAAPPADGSSPTSLTPGANGLLTGTLGAIPADNAPATPAAPTTPAAPSAADKLQSGLDAYAKKNYNAALAVSESVLATDRATSLGYDALFLKARALAGKHDWQNAAVAFDDTYKRARFGSHSQDAQLGEARALMVLGDDGAACGALVRLIKQYPTPRADLAKPIAALRAKACRN